MPSESALGRGQGQRLANSGGHVVVALFDRVTVDAERHPRIGVPEPCADRDWIEPSGAALGGGEVAQCVQMSVDAGIGRSAAGESRHDVRAHRLGSCRRPRKHEGVCGHVEAKFRRGRIHRFLWWRRASRASGSRPIVRTWCDFVPFSPHPPPDDS